MAKILMVDDEPHVCELVQLYLKREGYEVVIAQDGRSALSQVAASQPDLIILDIMLPQLDGWQVCRTLRQQGNSTPIIMLSAKGEELDKITGLELGADDYVAKPFSPNELVARVKALLRRSHNRTPSSSPVTPESQSLLRFAKLTIDKERHLVLVGGAEGQQENVLLTPREFALLWFLASYPGRVFTRAQLLDKVWGYDFYGDTRTVDAHIKSLRQKIEENPSSPRFLKTVWGVGYKFEA